MTKQIDQTKMNHWNRLNKGRKFLIIIILCVVVLWSITLVAIWKLEQENTRRYRSENYDRFRTNIQMFQRIMMESEGFLRNVNTSLQVLPALESFTAEDFYAVKREPGFTIAKDTYLFELDTPPHRYYNRLLGLVMANDNYSELIHYFPSSDMYLVLTQNGHFQAMCHGEEELRMLVNMQGEFIHLNDGDLVLATATQYASSPLYIVWRLGESYLLCGMSEETVASTLLLDNAGRSYTVEQMACVLDDGQRIFRENVPMPGGEATLGGTEQIEVTDDHTIMRFHSEEPRFTLIACLRETGTTNVLSSSWFKLLLVLNGLWVLSLAITYSYSIVQVFNPLRRISEEVSVQETSDTQQNSADDLERIASTIHHYHQQLSLSRKTIDKQIVQLRGACLKQLASGQFPTLTQEQLDELGIPELLSRYLLITMYPENGHWGRDDCSEQEYRYLRHVIVAAVSDTLSPQLDGFPAQYLMLQSCLLMVVQVPDDAAEAFVRQRVEGWVALISAQLTVRLRFGISKVRSGMDSFGRAYHEAQLHAALVEEQETGRSQEISLNALLKQSMHMADLIYMERYSDAYASFKEMVETILQQKGRHLRAQQLSSLLQLTLTMVTETNEFNANLLEQSGVDTAELCQTDEEDKVLERWESVFSQLEMNKSEQIHGQYSSQFAAVYQYMLAHFRDPGLSLSMLAEEFGMSISTLSREFQKNLGQGFLESLHHMRIETARYEIEHTATPLSEIATAVGYTNTLTMTRAFKKYLNCTPGVFRKKESS